MKPNGTPNAAGNPRSPARTGHAFRRVLLRYVLFQIPELAFVALALAVGVEWTWLAPATAYVVFATWLLKDALLFPFVRQAYEPHDGRLPRDPRGQIGVAPDGVEDEGYVVLGPERWRSRRSDGSRPIEPGADTAEQARRFLAAGHAAICRLSLADLDRIAEIETPRRIGLGEIACAVIAEREAGGVLLDDWKGRAWLEQHLGVGLWESIEDVLLRAAARGHISEFDLDECENTLRMNRYHCRVSLRDEHLRRRLNRSG